MVSQIATEIILALRVLPIEDRVYVMRHMDNDIELERSDACQADMHEQCESSGGYCVCGHHLFY